MQNMIRILNMVERHFISIPLLEAIFKDLVEEKSIDAKMFYGELPDEVKTQLRGILTADLSSRGAVTILFDELEMDALEDTLAFIGTVFGIGPIKLAGTFGETYAYDVVVRRSDTFAHVIAQDGADDLDPLVPGETDKKFLVFIQALSREEVPIYRRVGITLARGHAVEGFLQRLIMWHNHYEY